jgi:hypothetical protein
MAFTLDDEGEAESDNEEGGNAGNEPEEIHRD